MNQEFSAQGALSPLGIRVRETLDTAYAGDTLTSDSIVVCKEMPRFTPECFTDILNTDPANIKRYRSEMEQLMKEGVAQACHVHGTAQAVPSLGAVGRFIAGQIFAQGSARPE